MSIVLLYFYFIYLFFFCFCQAEQKSEQWAFKNKTSVLSYLQCGWYAGGMQVGCRRMVWGISGKLLWSRTQLWWNQNSHHLLPCCHLPRMAILQELCYPQISLGVKTTLLPQCPCWIVSLLSIQEQCSDCFPYIQLIN